MGLLDLFANFNPEDPKTQGLLGLAAGLLTPTRGGKFAPALGMGIQQGLQNFNRSRAENVELANRRGYGEMQQGMMDDRKRDRDFQSAIASGYQPAINPLTPNDDEGNPMPRQAQGFDFSAAMKIDPLRAMQIQQSMAPKAPEYRAYSPGQHVVEMTPQGPVERFRVPEKQPDWKDPEYVQTQMRIRAAGKPEITTNVMPPREIFKDSLTLKKDFDGLPEVKGFKEVRGAWDQISTALKAPSAANDLAAATKFMKLLDPGSVVRESELAMAMQASGVLDRFMNTASRIKSGHKLTPSQREDFYKSGEALFKAAESRYGQSVEQYKGIADKYGLDSGFLGGDKPGAPKPGTRDGDFYFKGGDPSDQKNWVKYK